MKLDKIVLFGMVLMFGVVLPQNTEAADEAGIRRLNHYMNNIIKLGKPVNTSGVDEIAVIISEDGKVDDDERDFMYSILEQDDRFDNKILSSESREIIQAIHDDYTDYNIEVATKYPELRNLNTRLGNTLRKHIQQLTVTNVMVKNHLSGDAELSAGLKKFTSLNFARLRVLLRELQAILDTSPYKTELTKIYDAEKLLYEENLKKFSEI